MTNAAVRTGARILVVEDHADSAKSMARLLNLLGHEVQVARDGPQAIASALDWRPAIILLDLGLPTMDGYEVATRLRQEASCRETVIIAVTGYGQPEDRQRCYATGIDHHLLKPVAPEVLLPLLSRSAAMCGAEPP
jgi:CheY-like chemotaxis protein